MNESAYYPPPEFRKGEEVYQRTTGDVYFVKSVERLVGCMKYAYNLVHCADLDGTTKSFREWEIGSNEPATE